ncbi:MAG TPA: LuxR C-terminal-related transcriptional regulator [Candidatus Tyrphobacter sp.]
MTPSKRASIRDHAWRSDFARAYGEARFKDAAGLYELHASASEAADIAIMAAQANMHAHPPVALRILLRVRTSSAHRRERIACDVLLAEAYARTRDFASADAKLDAALKAARKIGDLDLLALVGYRCIRRHLFAEDPAAARGFLNLARGGTSERARIYALYAETLILPYEERVREQAERLVELLRSLDPGGTAYMDVRAWATHTLAVLAREIPVAGAIAEVERQLGGAPWPADFAMNRFQALKALGWAKAMQGDYFNAFRYLKAASATANTDSWNVVAACDRAYLARCLGEHRWSRAELDEAERLANGVDWQSTRGEERMGLLLLAELFSGIDTSRAAMYLARHWELGEMASALHYRHDARLNAFAQYSTGIVELALGERKRGLAELRAAFETFKRFGYDFRAARCLLAEYAVTRKSDLLTLAEERLRNYGQSWLAAELRGLGERNEISLPPMQQRVFAEICKGKSNAEIAKTLERSPFTVSNHIKQIFKTFRVGSRSALVAEAIRRGLIKTS